MPALFVISDRKVTCRFILHAFSPVNNEINEVMDNMSCMMHRSLCLCFIGLFFFYYFNSMECLRKILMKSFIQVLLTYDIVHGVLSRIGNMIPDAC